MRVCKDTCDWELFIRRPLHRKWLRYHSKPCTGSHVTLQHAAKRHLEEGLGDVCSYLIRFKGEESMRAMDQQKGRKMSWDPKLPIGQIRERILSKDPS